MNIQEGQLNVNKDALNVQEGRKVTVDCRIKFGDGTLYYSSDRAGRPMEFRVGAGEVLGSFEKAIRGMKEGERKTFSIQPEDAYGKHDPRKIVRYPIDQVPRDVKPEVGTMINVTLRSGERRPGWIAAVTPEAVVVDLNHPLAGRILNCRVTVLNIAS